MPQFDTTWFISQLFWLAVCFVWLYVVLSRKVLPRLLATIARREETRSGDLSTAQYTKTQAEIARDQYEKALAEARANAHQQITTALAASKKRSDQTSTEMDRTVAKQIAEAERDIRARKDALLQQLVPANEEIVALMVEKLTRHKPASDIVHSAIQTTSRHKGAH